MDLAEPNTMGDNMSTTSSDHKTLYSLNRSIGEPWFSLFVASYLVVFIIALTLNVMMAFSACRIIRGDSLLLHGFYRRPPPRSKLAKDSLILCLLLCDIGFLSTSTFTAVDGLTKYWPMEVSPDYGGRGQGAGLAFSAPYLVCKIAKAAPAVPVYCSTLILMVIAVDRYHTIVYSRRSQLLPKHVAIIAPTALSLSFMMAYPIFHHTRIYTLNTTTVRPGYESISFCIEDWQQLSDNVTDQDPGSRIHYSIFSMAFQFLIPFVLISAIYFCIYIHLNKHKRLSINAYQKRHGTSQKLLFQSLGFCICWLPLNTFGLMMDIDYQLFGNNPQTVLIIFFVCHLIGLCSTLFNPIVYCYWNEGFKREFLAIMRGVQSMLAACPFVGCLLLTKRNTTFSKTRSSNNSAAADNSMPGFKEVNPVEYSLDVDRKSSMKISIKSTFCPSVMEESEKSCTVRPMPRQTSNPPPPPFNQEDKNKMALKK